MKPAELARARILVTNDDGIHAPGLEALIEIATQLSSDVWVVAPEVNQSGAGHSLSLSRPIRCREVSEARFALDGFYRNGRRVKLFGADRHQFFPFAGGAMPARVQARAKSAFSDRKPYPGWIASTSLALANSTIASTFK